jgi:hypothetical protein
MPFGITQAGNIKKPFHKSLFFAKITNNGFLTCNCFDLENTDYAPLAYVDFWLI